jgi:broad specificity phosphatase PhoE
VSELLWPASLLLVRHGESAGNVARDEAEAAGHTVIALETRDMDTPLSDLGRRQAAALGRWLSDLGDDERPTVALSSPYVRARDTAAIAIDAATWPGDPPELVVDERLREREFGILDRLTKTGIKERFPDQAELRTFLGKFYHRPPGGESWADVVLRLRTVLDTIAREYGGERLLVVTHQVVILMFRYLFERLSEEEVLEIDRQNELSNCSVTSYRYDPDAVPRGAMVLERFNEPTPLEEEGAPVTHEPDVAAAQG